MPLAILIGFALVFSVCIFLLQNRMIYYPSRYDSAWLDRMRGAITFLPFETSQGSQQAYYVPPRAPAADGAPPERLWVLFHGNAARALDWLDTIEPLPDAGAAYLLVDFPGYGASAGKPTPGTILEASQGALDALARDLNLDRAALNDRLHLMGYSLGAAAALQLARHTGARRIVLLAPFSDMLAMARRTVGWPLACLLRHRFDNRAALAALAERPERPAVTILHGDADPLVPVEMSRQMAREHDWIELIEVPRADHDWLLDMAGDRLPAAMGMTAAPPISPSLAP